MLELSVWIKTAAGKFISVAQGLNLARISFWMKTEPSGIKCLEQANKAEAAIIIVKIKTEAADTICL